MNRVIITGATSMIGQAVVEECLEQGKQVCAVIRKDTKQRTVAAASQPFSGGVQSGRNEIPAGKNLRFLGHILSYRLGKYRREQK